MRIVLAEETDSVNSVGLLVNSVGMSRVASLISILQASCSVPIGNRKIPGVMILLYFSVK